jgi:hypothetical protein
MTRYRRYVRGRTPVGSYVIRLVQAGDRVEGFIRRVEAEDEEDSVYPTEQKPVDQVFRLADSKQKAEPGAQIFVELEAGLEWNEEWGLLEG